MGDVGSERPLAEESSSEWCSPFLRPVLHPGPWGEVGTVNGICFRLEGKTIRDKYLLNTGLSLLELGRDGVCATGTLAPDADGGNILEDTLAVGVTSGVAKGVPLGELE